jgi:hypothetical protein
MRQIEGVKFGRFARVMEDLQLTQQLIGNLAQRENKSPYAGGGPSVEFTRSTLQYAIL